MTEFSTIPSDQIRCNYFPICSGCEIHDGVTSPQIYNDVKSFFQSMDPSLLVPLYHQEIIGWRTRSKLAVRGREIEPEIGLFKKGTHEVVSIPDCPLHHPAINKAYEAVRQKIIEMKLPPYREDQLTGILRYLQFVVERKSRRVQLSLSVNRQGKDPVIDRFVKQLYKEGMFLGIWVNYLPGSTNRIFGDKWELIAGEPYLVENLCGLTFSLHPACFAQAHLSLFEKILKSVQQSIQKDSSVVEFYAGIGVIGLSVVHLCKKVICSEINPYSEECFHLSRLQLAPDLQKKVSFILGSVEKKLDLVDQGDVLIVDPPRKGLDPCLLDKILSSSHLKQLIYVSCGFYSFKRDCEKLLEKGWKVEKAEAYLLFPGTNHVETLCVLTRCS
ncbi:MAG: class I SAM-dependent RNA methyltransferase [Parachlamydiales bacterium]|nr:class I SAM-dependent RNA methyltransferase [Candidatus Acheromyda pituitae]